MILLKAPVFDNENFCQPLLHPVTEVALVKLNKVSSEDPAVKDSRPNDKSIVNELPMDDLLIELADGEKVCPFPMLA